MIILQLGIIWCTLFGLMFVVTFMDLDYTILERTRIAAGFATGIMAAISIILGGIYLIGLTCGAV